MVLTEIPPDEYASALLGVGIVGNQAKTPFALVAEDLEFRHEIADACLERLRRHDNCDAAVLGPLNGSRLFKIRQQHLADPRRRVATATRHSASSCSTRPTSKSTSTFRRHARGVGERLGGRGAFLVRPGAQGRPSVRHLERLEAALTARPIS
jgi:hypothetical protein